MSSSGRPKDALRVGQGLYESRGTYPLFLRVVRVARDYSWIDVRFFNWAATWARRMYRNDSGFALLHQIERKEWTVEELKATVPSDQRLREKVEAALG